MLDELNKYAPREGRSPIKEVLLDIAERGRSLGVVLIGAQQTASEIERRVTANASFRVVGRLDAAGVAARRVRLPDDLGAHAGVDPEAGQHVPAAAGRAGAASGAVPVPRVGDARRRGRLRARLEQLDDVFARIARNNGK